MHLGDISNAMRPSPVAAEWANLLQDEFFKQGDAERAAAVPVSPFMDRNAANLPQLQLNFIDYIVRPLIELAAAISPALKPLFDQVVANRSFWNEAKTRAMA